MKILYVVSEDWYFVSHRLSLAVSMLDDGHDVVVATRIGRERTRIETAGIRLIELRQMRRSSLNPYKEARALLELASIYWNERPDIVHHVALKPAIYGTLAARTTKSIRWVNALGGLGFAFSSQRKLAKFLRPVITAVLRFTLNSSRGRVIVQNSHDFSVLVDSAKVDPECIRLIRGAGVEIGLYSESPFDDGPPVVMMASRMLWDKGVGEFVAAAELARRQGVEARFVLVGNPDPENPGSVSEEQLREWSDSRVVEWWGHRTDMHKVLRSAQVVCLPSYYGEGIPKVMLEAMASARPIITTDTPGCRELVRDGLNGILVQPRDAVSLAIAFQRLVSDKVLCENMGAWGRKFASRDFSYDLVLAKTKEVYSELHDRRNFSMTCPR